MPYFKCVSNEGPILACYIEMVEEKVSIRWGPGMEKKDCWYKAWPDDALFILDGEDPILLHHTRENYRKSSLPFSDEICHFIPVSRNDEIGKRGNYYCLV